MISTPQIFRNRNVFVLHNRFKRRGKVIHRRLRRSTGLPRRRMNNFENGIRRERHRSAKHAKRHEKENSELRKSTRMFEHEGAEATDQGRMGECRAMNISPQKSALNLCCAIKFSDSGDYGPTAFLGSRELDADGVQAHFVLMVSRA